MDSGTVPPHIALVGVNRKQIAGRSFLPKSKHFRSTVNCTQRTPAGLPLGMPGMGEEIEGAMQQAAQLGRHSTLYRSGFYDRYLND
jgi:hypothetical protein